MSIRQGLRPSIHTFPGFASSSSVGACSPKPKATRARRKRAEFWALASTNTSRSSVSLGSPCAATACPPTRRNRAPSPIKSDKNSDQSALSWIFTEPNPPQPIDRRDALLEREPRVVLAIHGGRLLEAPRHAKDALDHA